MTPLAPVPSNIDHSVTPTPQNSRPPLKQRKGHNPPAARKSKPPRRPPAPIDVAPINTQSQEPPQMATYPPPICPPHVDGSSQVGTAYATHHHPHLRQMCIFVNSFPPDLEETVLADALRGCLPIRIKLNPAVPNEARLLPDMHYDWMPRNGTIEFTKMDDAERALAILTNHTIFTPRGVWFSPYPPPHILPLPDSPLSTRYIRPTKLALAPSLPANPTPEQNFRAYVPTPSEVFDAVRPWGCIRSVNSYLQQTEVEGQLNDSAQGHLWMAQVEFWYEDEASRFEVGFGESCSLIKGWQVHIHGTASQPGSIPMTLPYQVPPRMLPPIQPQPFLPPTSDSMHYLPPTVGPMGDFSIQQMGVMYLGPDSLPATPLTANIPMIPNIPIGGAGYIPEGHVDRSPLSSPVTPRSMGGRMSRASMSSLYARQRSWSLTVGESPDGELRPTGLVADDGTFIQHGPGQHIRPAPAYGPGSSSVSGLVDYSNIFVKNLDPDINSYFLEDLFSNVGQVVSARVMRDEQGRSRCYGFVSFQLPEQAAQAISAFHDTVVGRSRISVTLHEPRRLRSEKTVECHDLSLATTFGRQPAGAPRRSMSPVRAGTIDRRRSTDGNATVPGSIENLCQLSPDSRKTALTERVSTRVRSYARTNDVRDDQIGPAIQALVKLDLSLIPLFHDRPKLDSKIAEVFNKLELAKPAPTASSPASPNSQSSGAEPCSSLRPTNAELVKLREEIEKIDPDNVNEVMPVLLEMLDSADWDQLWINSGVAKKYGEAKRLLASQEDRTQVNTPNEDQQQLAKVVEIDEPPTNLIDLSGHHKNDDHAIPLEGLSIESLAFHSAKKIIDDLQGKNGLALHQELGLIAPTASEKSSLECWLTKLMMKGKVERGVEVASLLGKKIENDTLKRSQKLKVIRDLINAEGDEEALCRLTLYPALLNAKVQALLRAGQ